MSHPLRALSVRAAEQQPFPKLNASEAKQREWLLIGAFLTRVFGLSTALGEGPKALHSYPGPYAVVCLAAWAPLAVVWNVFGVQR